MLINAEHFPKLYTSVPKAHREMLLQVPIFKMIYCICTIVETSPNPLSTEVDYNNLGTKCNLHGWGIKNFRNYWSFSLAKMTLFD